ncbi:MAG TPA: hypothetical protein PKE27_18030 [Povalibacter sp.]|uniref:hypothetical protein n=1 Tax=Povalibacter sp. TaxID=1962978 RepID=UPI002D02F4A4|nr:hypothetical protein [Povalibacter sp.]HMN46480.1 hypothetical protein [Povalibacter sp.]
MSTEPPYLSEVLLSLSIAILVSSVLWRRQRKHQRTVGTVRGIAVFLVAAVAALASLLLLAMALRQAGVEPGRWSQQAIQVSAALVAYLVAGKTLAQINKHAD